MRVCGLVLEAGKPAVLKPGVDHVHRAARRLELRELEQCRQVLQLARGLRAEEPARGAWWSTTIRSV